MISKIQKVMITIETPRFMYPTNETLEEMLGGTKTSKSWNESCKGILKKIHEFLFSNVDSNYHNSIRKMLATVLEIQSEKPERIGVVEHHDDLTKSCLPF